MKTRQDAQGAARYTMYHGRNTLGTWVREVLGRVREEERLEETTLLAEEVGKTLLQAARTACSRALKDRAPDETSRKHLRDHHEAILFELMKGYPPSWVLERVLGWRTEGVPPGQDEERTGTRGGTRAGIGTLHWEMSPSADEVLDALEPLETRTVRFTLGELRALRSTAGSTARPRVKPIGIRPFGERTPPPPRDPWWNDADRDAVLARLGFEPPEGVGVTYEVRAANLADARLLLAQAKESTMRTPKRNINARGIDGRAAELDAVLLVRRAPDLKHAFLATLGHPDAAEKDFGARFTSWTSELSDTLEITFEATLWSPLLTRRQLVRLAERAWQKRLPVWGSRQRIESREESVSGEAEAAAEVAEPEGAAVDVALVKAA